MFAINKNSILQLQASFLKPQVINRSVDHARGADFITDAHDFAPPFFRVTSEQPDIPIENVDPTRRPVAFGNLALPKLRRELHNQDEAVVNAALTSLCDLAHDPEKGFEALRLRIPDRLADLLVKTLATIRERAVLLLSILAQLASGKEAILQNSKLFKNLLLCLNDEIASIRMKAASCFEVMAESWMVADVLVDKKLIQTLLKKLETGELPEIVKIYLKTLKSLMYNCGMACAFKNDGFRIFLCFLDSEDKEIVYLALECLAILTSMKNGKKLALETNILKTLNKLLHYGDIKICTSAAAVLMFCTIKTRAKFKAAEIRNLSKQLVMLSKNHLTANLQMFCLKALTNICEHPTLRTEVRDNYGGVLKELELSENNVEHKKKLLKTVYWSPSKWDDVEMFTSLIKKRR